MRVRWMRLVAGAVAAEIAAIVMLVCIVAIFGPHESKAAEAYAEKMGRWVGPLAGVVFSFAGALWIARPLREGRMLHAASFGCLLALIDAALLFAMQASFEWLFVFSNLAKIVAALAGGVCAGRTLHTKPAS